MENYKTKYYHPVTFEESEIETKIPTQIVTEVSKALNNLTDYYVTPLIINPHDLSVVLGIMDNERLKYKITITQGY
jgi:hypothetical protein